MVSLELFLSDIYQVDGRCATSVYKNTGTYYSYKYCDADELALGITTVTSGSGTTVTGEACVPMVNINQHQLISSLSFQMISLSSHKIL